MTRNSGSGIMVKALLVVLLSFFAMLLPHLPGGFDASAHAISFIVQVGSFTSLLFVPIGLAWLVNERRASLWRRAMQVVAGIVVVISMFAAAAMDHLSLGVIVLVLGAVVLSRASAFSASNPASRARLLPACLVAIPILLVAFRVAALPRAYDWSRNRAIAHSARLIAEIESYRERHGRYPVSLQSLNRDVPTGVVGIERFSYEPAGESFHLFFIRPHIQLDAQEVVIYDPRGEPRFTSHELDMLQYDGEQLDLRRGDRRRTALAQANWVSILFD